MPAQIAHLCQVSESASVRSVESILEETLARLRSGDLKATQLLIIGFADLPDDEFSFWLRRNCRNTDQLKLVAMAQSQILVDLGF